MKQFCTLFVLICSLAVSSIAQDKHFTQFYASPMNLNPALTGGFDGTYRFSFLYRDQWARVLDRPYTTFNASLDLRFPIGYNQTRSEDGVGIGLMFDTDRVANVGYSNTAMHFFGAFHKSLNSRNNQYLSGGIQIGLNQRNINNARLTFEDQFDGSTGFTGQTREFLPRENSFAFADFSVGINYSYSPSRSAGLFIGAAMHHVFEPEISYYFNRRTNDPDLGSEQLLQKYTAHIGGSIPIGNRAALTPRVMGRLQGSHLEINAGSNVRLSLGEFGGSAMHLGGWVRPATNESNAFNLETAILMVGFETDNVLFGFSYDLSISDLQTVQAGQGSFEISVAYLGN
ncbi:MAG: PorP/SprF family type IX secretion system membrane protein, partial [Bacteroidota bacterium]